MWNTAFFQKTTLRELGLRIQLGHAPGVRCPTSENGHKDFTVIHTNGVHSVSIDFCRCRLVPHYKHLLRIAWWPATPLYPKTCATMECLRQFHLLNLKANVTTFGYYGALLHMMDNMSLEEIPVSLPFRICYFIYFNNYTQDQLPAFTLMTREFRHTKMLKRNARAYDPGGVLATCPAIPCRACPLPNINLPPGWDHIHPEKAYVHIFDSLLRESF